MDITEHYVQLHPTMGMVFAFFAAFLESLPVLGLIIPGTIVMTAVGAMIGAGWLPGYITLCIAILGAFLGDIIGFSIGYIFKDKLRQIWPFKQYPKIIAYSSDFITKHGGKSILIGRFVGASRSAVPMVAGLLHLSWIRFLIAAFPTAIVWTIVYTLPGILFGAFSLDIPSKLLTEYLIIGLIILSLLWLSYWLIQRFFNKIYTYYHSKMQQYWHFIQRHSRHGLVNMIANQQDINSHLQLNRCFLLLICLLLFVMIAINVYLKTALFSINLPLFNFAQSLRIYHLNSFFVIITLMGSPQSAALVGIGLSGLLAIAKQWRASLHLLAATFMAFFAVTTFKWLQFNPRPSGFMLTSPSSSFPSGHTTISLVVFGLLTFFTAQYFKNYRGMIYAITSIFITLVGISRLYLGAHWFLDVLGGVFLGLTLLLLIIVSYQRLPKPTSALHLHSVYWLCLSFLLTACVWSVNIYHNYQKNLYSTMPFQQKTVLALTDWWQNPHNYVPLYRNNRFGYPIQPLNIEWAGNLDHIKNRLLANDWKLITRDNHVKDTIQRLSSLKPQYHLPLFELLYRNEPPALIMYKPTTDDTMIYVIRLWDSHIELNNKTPLWIGMLNKGLSPNKKMLGLHHEIMSFSHLNASHILFNSTQQYGVQSRILTEDSSSNTYLKGPWDGKVWLFLTN